MPRWWTARSFYSCDRATTVYGDSGHLMQISTEHIASRHERAQDGFAAFSISLNMRLSVDLPNLLKERFEEAETMRHLGGQR